VLNSEKREGASIYEVGNYFSDKNGDLLSSEN
jgi:hypothetical protein